MPADLEYFDGFWIDWNELLNDDDKSGETVVQDTKRRRCENQSIPVKHQYPIVQVQQVLYPVTLVQVQKPQSKIIIIDLTNE